MLKALAKILSLALIFSFLTVAPAEAKARPKAFNGKTCTIVGTNKSQKITGTAKADVICGLGGNDKIDGKGGNDTIDAGTGNDIVAGGTGNDVISAGVGNDTVNGSAGNDVIDGGVGNDSITGSDGNDTLSGSAGEDVLSGNNGNDVVDGGSGNDVLSGGIGTNKCSGGASWWLELDQLDPVTCGDVNAPHLSSLNLSTSNINTSGSSQTIDITVGIQDDLTGIGNLYSNSLSFRHSATGQWLSVMFNSSNRISGTSTNGTYRATLTIPWGAGQGTWNAEFELRDSVGNYRNMTSANLNAAGLTSGFNQAGPGDLSAPTVTSMSLSTGTVNTTSSSQTIDITVGIQDDLTGIGNLYSNSLSFRHSATGQWLSVMFNSSNRISGTSTNGTYQATLTIPWGAGQGTWNAEFELRDSVGNYRNMTSANLNAAGLTSGFNQAGPGDLSAPTVTSMSLSTGTVNTTSSSQTIDITVGIQDDLTGIGNLYSNSLSFRHSATGQWLSVMFNSSNRISGTSTNGTYQATLTVPIGAAKGFWEGNFELRDSVGNYRVLNKSALDAAGLVSGFTNTN